VSRRALRTGDAATGAQPVVPPPAAAAPDRPGVPAGTGNDPADPAGDPAGPPERRRRGLLAAGAVVLAALLVGGGVTAWLLLRDDAEPAPQAGPVVVAPVPTSTVAPAPRAATTAFATALPPTLLQYALSASAPDEEWLAAGAVEAYAETYADGGTGTVEVRAGQWPTPEEAAAALATVTAGLPAASADAGATPAPGTAVVLLQGDVLVGGQPTGTATVLDAGDGTGVAAWSNGTTVFRVTGPAADIRNLYAAYPL